MSIDSNAPLPIYWAPRKVLVTDFSDSEDSSKATTSDDDDEQVELKKTPEYWHIQKLMRYVKSTDQSATVVALCCLKDHDLTMEINQLAVVNVGGLELLTNILETKETASKLVVMKILIQIANNVQLRQNIVNLGVVELLINNLEDPSRDILIAVGETLQYFAEVRKGRTQVRKFNGIPKLVNLLDVNNNCLMTPFEELGIDDQEFVCVAASAAKALWVVSRSRKNVSEILKFGGACSLSRLVRSVHTNIIIPTIGTVSNCCVNSEFRLAVRTENIIEYIVKYLITEDVQLKTACSSTIFNCAEDSDTRNMIREAGGIPKLIEVVQGPHIHNNIELLQAVTGAIWKTARSPENVKVFNTLGTINVLVKIILNTNEDTVVLSNTIGALAEFLKSPQNRAILRTSGGIAQLVYYLNMTDCALLENLSLTLRECAKDEDSMRIIEELDGVRLVWSLLKNDSPIVKTSAALALVLCLRNGTDSGEMCRSFVGALGLTVNLLHSPHENVLASVCAVLAEIANDHENLGIISDNGVVPLLVNLVGTENDLLRENLSLAIAYCCNWGSNSKNFGRLGVITPLVEYMAADNVNVHRTTALALYRLSGNLFNCITMHESGVIPFLLRDASSSNMELQDAAAGCLKNMRRLALDAETYHLITRYDPQNIQEEEDI